MESSKESDLQPRHPRPAPRGFTLVELAIVLAVIGVLSGVAAVGLRGLKTRGNFASATGDFITALRRTRAEAYGRGSTTVFVVDTLGGNYWGIEDVGGDFDITHFDPSNPTVPTSLPTPYPGDDILLLSGTLPGCSGAANGCKEVSFGPADGYGGSLPAPYQFVANANRSCNFCLTGAQDGFGSVTFSVGSPSAISNSVATGAAISIQGLQGSRINSMTFVVVARTGATESFERGYH